MQDLKKILLTVLIFIIAPSAMMGQFSFGDLNLDNDTFDWYDRTVGLGNEGLYEGTFFQSSVPPITSTTHLYFKDRYWEPGEITFRGEEFINVNLHYDLYHDVLLILNKSLIPLQPIKVNQQMISEFSLRDARFVNLQDTVPTLPHTGFFEILYGGESLKMLVKRRKSKEIVEREVSFQSEDDYYLVADGNYVKYKGKRTLTRIFKADKRKIKDRFKLQSLAPEMENDERIKELMSYCDSLDKT